MDNFDTPPVQSTTGAIVIALVVAGLGLVSLGGYLVYSKKNAQGHQGLRSDGQVAAWCELRQQWARKVDGLAGDILLKSVNKQDAAQRDALLQKRDALCRQYAAKVVQLKITDPALQRAEVAMVKEGKARANIAVEIENFLTKIDILDSTLLRTRRDQLAGAFKQRIQGGESQAKAELDSILSGLGDSCTGVYSGAMTTEGAAESPYISWAELELRRTQALRLYDKRIIEMEPAEQFTNRVYHDLVAKYRKTLKKCYQRAKARNPEMSDEFGLRVRLKKDGKVATLAIEWMTNRDEQILDCLLAKASGWRLPRPITGMDVVVVRLDLASL